MDNISNLILDLSFEGYTSELQISVDSSEGWQAKLVDVDSEGRKTALLDREGDKFLFARGDSIEEAINNLDVLCG